MKSLILIPLILAGCASNHISQFDLAKHHCDEGLQTFCWQGECKSYTLHVTDDPNVIGKWCGGAKACIRGEYGNPHIYVSEWCESYLPHELGHLFSIPGTDRPQVGLYR